MKTNIYGMTVLLVTATLSWTGCTSSFDEVNTDPDRPTKVDASNILAHCLRDASDNLFDEWFDLNESSNFAGQVSKLTYTEEGYYNFRPNVNNTSWAVNYLLISNLKDIIDMSEAAGKTNMKAVATIFQSQIFQLVTDRWRDAPYSEAAQLETIKKPRYDKQEDIYPSLLAKLKTAADELDVNGDALGNGDVLFNGDIDLWKRYCNSLRLRLAIRISKVSEELARETINEIMSNPAKYPLIEENSQNAFFHWGNEYPEPWADYYRARADEYGISNTLVTKLNQYADPRLPAYAEPNANGQYVGYPNGLKAYATVTNFSKIGKRFMRDLSGFTPWFRASETYFTLAEAAKLGFNSGSETAESAYNKAVRLSMEENEVADAAITNYLSAGAGKYNGTDEQLYDQLWISLFKQGMEAWSTYRRTGYPSTNRVAPDSYYPGHYCPPLRYSYPDTEANLNTENYTIASATIVDNFWGEPMWWGKSLDVETKK